METDILQLPDAAPAFLVVWVIGVFVLWFLYRYNPYFSRAKFLTMSSVGTALLFFVLSWLWYRERPPSDPYRVGVFPLVDVSPQHEPLSSLSLLTAEVAASALPRADGNLLVYPVDWLRQVIQADSLPDGRYVERLAAALRLDLVFWGTLRQQPDRAGELRLSLQALRPGAPGEVDRWQRTVQLTYLTELATDLERFIPGRLASNGAAGNPFDGIGDRLLRWYGEAQLARWKGEGRKARAAAEKAAGADTSFVPAMLLWAEALIDTAGRRRQDGLEAEAFPLFRLAKSLLQKVTERDSANATAYRLLGRLYIWNERWDQAEEHLKRSQQINWWQPELYLEVSRLHPTRYAEFGARQERHLYERAIFIYPGCLRAYLELADYYEFRHQWSRSKELLEAFLRIHPNSVDALMALGRHYVNHADIVDVLQLYQRITDLDPGNDEAYYSVGVAYYNRGDLATAEQFFNKAIRLSDHLNSHLYLAMIYHKRGDDEKAVEELRYRLKHRKGRKDPYAEEARKLLFRILNTPEISSAQSQP